MRLSWSLLALLVAPLLASPQALDPEQVSFDCMTNPDRNHAVYAGDGACKCFTPSEAAPTPGYRKCPAPTLGGDVGFPHCVAGACKFICPKDYDMMPDGCKPFRPAGGLPIKTLTSLQCEKYEDQPALVSLASGGCSCRERADPNVDGTYCTLPPNAIASCESDIRNIDVGICSFTCIGDRKPSEDGLSCVAKTSTDAKPFICAPHQPLAYARSGKRCACYEDPEDATTMDVKCPAPTTGHGTPGCRNLNGNKDSECWVQCEAKFKASADGKTCVADAPPPVVQKLSECTPAGTQLWVHPFDGCVCASKRPSGSTGCYRPGGDGDAVCTSDGSKKNATCDKVCDDGGPIDAKGDCSEA